MKAVFRVIIMWGLSYLALTNYSNFLFPNSMGVLLWGLAFFGAGFKTAFEAVLLSDHFINRNTDKV